MTATDGVRSVFVNYPGLPTDVKVGATILLDSGLIRLVVVELDPTGAGDQPFTVTREIVRIALCVV